MASNHLLFYTKSFNLLFELNQWMVDSSTHELFQDTIQTLIIITAQ